MINLNLFKGKTVEGILGSFHKSMADLESLAKKNTAKASSLVRKIEADRAKHQAITSETIKALAVRKNIEKLIQG